jgi:hypothetical protein
MGSSEPVTGWIGERAWIGRPCPFSPCSSLNRPSFLSKAIWQSRLAVSFEWSYFICFFPNVVSGGAEQKRAMVVVVHLSLSSYIFRSTAARASSSL